MKYILTPLFLFFFIFCHAQRFTAGVVSGTGFSDFHGFTNTGKWETRAGTLAGIFLKYSLTPVFGIETGLDYTSQNYNYREYTYNGNIYYVLPAWLMNNDIVYSGFSANQMRWDFGFLRMPLYVTASTPTKLRLTFSAGIYLSRTVHHEFSADGVNYPTYINGYYPYYGEPETPKLDNGFAYAASLSYPVADQWRIQVSGRYFIGRKNFMEPIGGRTGTKELTLGIGYSGLFKSKKPSAAGFNGDTTEARFFVTPIAGISFNHIISSENTEGFQAGKSLTAGLELEFRINPQLSLISGLIFQRKGYRMDDSSSLYYRHGPSAIFKNEVKTRTDLDYAVIPILVKIHTGPPVDVYFQAGPYFGMLLKARNTGTASYEISYTSGFQRDEINVYDDIGGDIRAFDFGWTFGTGLQFPLPGGYVLNAGLNYDLGTRNILSDEIENHYSNSNEDQVMRNRSFNILLGLSIPIQKTEK